MMFCKCKSKNRNWWLRVIFRAIARCPLVPPLSSSIDRCSQSNLKSIKHVSSGNKHRIYQHRFITQFPYATDDTKLKLLISPCIILRFFSSSSINHFFQPIIIKIHKVEIYIVCQPRVRWSTQNKKMHFNWNLLSLL